MDVMEPSSMHDPFQGLSSNSLLDGTGLGDANDRDSLLDLLSQSFPDMLMQPYGHLSSLPLDAPDLQLSIQEDDDYQESDSADDSILQEFVCEVQNILSDTKRTNVSDAPDLGLSSIAPLLPTPEDPFSPVKRLCPDQLDLLMGPLLDGDEDDFKPKEKTKPAPEQPSPTVNFNVQISNVTSNLYSATNRDQSLVKTPTNGKPAIACVKPIMKETVKPVVDSKPLVSVMPKQVVTDVRQPVKIVKTEEESSDEVDIETVDDDELNGRSGAEVLSAKLANMECQAARARVVPSKNQVKTKPFPLLSTIQVEKGPKASPDQSHLAKSSTVPSFPPAVKPSPKLKEKEQSPSTVVEKIKQSAVAPRSSILIPHQGPPQLRGKGGKQENTKSPKSSHDDSATSVPSPYDARTLDHDYCNMGVIETPIPSTAAVKDEPEPWVVLTDILCVAEESVLSSDFDIPDVAAEVCCEIVQSDPKLTENRMSRGASPLVSQPVRKEPVTPVVKQERELPLSYRKWNHSRSPSPYSQASCKKRVSRRRSSCSPSSVSSQSIYRSRSRSSSPGRKGHSHTHHRRKHSRGRRNHPRRSMKRSRYNYSRSSSRSSYSSRSPSQSLSRSRSRTRSPSRSRSRSRSWDYKRKYNRGSYGWSQDKRHFHDEKTQQIEERRVVYVGRLPDGITKNDLRLRFGCFGPIQDVSIHFRNTGHNYGFVTFSYKRDAYEAVEHGNDDPNQPKFDLSFGGRRQFCRQRYADLDSQYNNNNNNSGSNTYSTQRPTPSNDFDSLLRAATLKLKKKY